MALLGTLATIGSAAWRIGKSIFKKPDGSNTQLANSLPAVGASIMTNRTNRKYAEKQYKQNLAMYHEQNAYNSPAAQMQRYKDAGLNPHLIYGQGTPGNAQNVPNLQYQPVNPMEFSSTMINSKVGAIDQGILQSQAAIRNIESQIAKRSLDVQFLDQTMEVRQNLLHQAYNDEWNRNNKLLLEYEELLKKNGYTGLSWRKNSHGTTLDITGGHKSANDFTMKMFEASLKRMYETNDALTLDNARRIVQNEFIKAGLSLNGGISMALARAMLRAGGLRWSPKSDIWQPSDPGSYY